MPSAAQGADDLAKVAKALKDAGNGGLRKELLAGIRAEGKPAITQARRVAGLTLPSSGGLASYVSTQPIGVRTRTAGRQAGIRIAASKQFGWSIDEDGIARHPVFGRKKGWVAQSVPSGWFTATMSANANGFRDGAVKAINDVAEKIGKST